MARNLDLQPSVWSSGFDWAAVELRSGVAPGTPISVGHSCLCAVLAGYRFPSTYRWMAITAAPRHHSESSPGVVTMFKGMARGSRSMLMPS